MCKCGIIVSSNNKKPMPSKNPIAAGRKESLPKLPDKSMEGIIKDHIDAATITPAAKPNKNF
jgi:hypothetical protein